MKIIKDKEGKSRGYGFVEFDRRRDFLSAFRQANGKRIDGKRIVVDAEVGRIKKKWRPRRFGGGRGETRKSKKHPYR